MSSDTGYVVFCRTILFLSGLISAYLTVKFLYSLGSQEGLGLGLVFALVGCCLDAVKTLGASISARVVERSKIIMVLMLAFTLVDSRP